MCYKLFRKTKNVHISFDGVCMQIICKISLQNLCNLLKNYQNLQLKVGQNKI